MSPSTAVLVGHGVIILLLCIALLLPDSWLGRELRRAYHVQTSGVSGRFASRDFVRAAMMSLVIGIVLIAGSVAAYSVSFSKHGVLARVLEGYGFGFFILGVVVLLTIIQSLWRSLGLLRGERRIAQLRAANSALFAAVREILVRHNVMGIEGEEASDEFDYEAARLLIPLSEASSYEDLLIGVYMFFAVWFTASVAGPPNRFAALSQELWNLELRSRAA